MSPVIQATGLAKRYGRAVAVGGVDFEIEKGEIFGLLGPNGSGKTTTILLLLGLTEPTAGSVRVLGFDPLRQPLEVKRRVGYLPDTVGFYDTLTARENLAYTARLAGLRAAEAGPRIEEALGYVRLTDVADRRVGTFSHGMRQRLGLAEVLAKRAEIAILDEPTSGLDPQSTQELLELIVKLSGEGMTIVLSSHMLEMVETICHRVALFNRGRIGLAGTVRDLASQVLVGTHVVEVEAEGIDLAAVLQSTPGVTKVARLGDDSWRVDADRDLRPEIARAVVTANGALRNMTIRQASLNEVYARFFTEANHVAA